MAVLNKIAGVPEAGGGAEDFDTSTTTDPDMKIVSIHTLQTDAMQETKLRWEEQEKANMKQRRKASSGGGPIFAERRKRGSVVNSKASKAVGSALKAASMLKLNK